MVLIHGYTSSAQGCWFDNGIAQALAKNHRVVAIDCRNHGRSDKPVPRGGGIPQDVIELMDHLKINKAHIHGYSMGGALTALLLVSHPERFITAIFGGFGIEEVDPEIREQIAPMYEKGIDPEEPAIRRDLRIRSAMDNGMTREQAEKAADGPPDTSPRPPSPTVDPSLVIDLAKVTIPVLGINGEFDRPLSRTHRMWRELKNFTNVILPGKSHLTAIAAPTIPKAYIENLVTFIDAHDE